MKKITVFLVAILFSALTASSQTRQPIPAKDATFCGKIGPNELSHVSYAVEELKNCDFKIIPLDSNLTVVEFQLGLVAKDNLYQYAEKKVKGNEVPEEYRSQILTQTNHFFLEKIKAVNKEGQLVEIKPIAVRIQYH